MFSSSYLYLFVMTAFKHSSRSRRFASRTAKPTSSTIALLMLRFALYKRDRIHTLENPGLGLCGAYSFYQGRSLYMHLNSEKIKFTRGGEAEGVILLKISTAMSKIKEVVESRPDSSFSTINSDNFNMD